MSFSENMSSERVSLLHAAARRLAEAERERRAITILSRSIPDLSIADAYKIAELRNAEYGDPVVGYKLGYTSEAMRLQMGVDEPNFGILTRRNRVSGNLIETGRLIHPMVEPELTLVMGQRLAGPGIDRDEAWEAVSAIVPSLEIVDTRYESYNFTAADNISDNSSAALFVLGAASSRTEITDLREVPVELSRDGKVIDTGWGRNAMGDPAVALAWLANTLSKIGKAIEPGEVVMTGGLTRAHRAEPGSQFSASFGVIGTVFAQFSGRN